MKVLLTGSQGYLGALVGPFLLGRGHDVVGLDTGYFRTGELYPAPADTPATWWRDVRSVTRQDLAGFQAVVHLA